MADENLDDFGFTPPVAEVDPTPVVEEKKPKKRTRASAAPAARADSDLGPPVPKGRGGIYIKKNGKLYLHPSCKTNA